MTMPAFDTINLDKNIDNDIVWDGKLLLDDRSIDAALWVTNADALNPDRLNKIATQCQNLSTLAAKATSALKSYLKEDNEFILTHINNIEKGLVPKLDAFRGTGGITDAVTANANANIDAFIDILYLNSISIWMTSDTLDGNTIWLDYMLDDNYSDQILTVRFTLDGTLKEVAWES